MANLNITNIPAPRVPFVDERTGLMAREWYRFFLNLFVLTGSGNNPITLEELQLGPPNQPSLAELLIQINQNIAPQYEDQSGDFLATLDTAQLMSMMSRFENAEAAIQGAYLQPVVQTGTIANYNLDNSPTAGGIAYGTGPALAVSAAGTLGQVLTSAGAGTPTWAAAATGTVTSVSVVSANGLAGTVATATTTPAITLSTTITGLLKGNGTAISAATSGTDYAPATSGTSILYGNGSGGFSNVTIGTGVAFSGGTLSATGSGGTVTSVTGTAPVVSSGGATPAISMAAATTSVNGYLTSTDWNTFNGKGSGSVTSVAQSFTGGLISVAGSPITTSGTLALTVAGTSGGIPYFSSASTWATSAALAAGSLVQGGGAGVAPSTITTGTGVITALGVNTGTAGAFVVNGGVLGTPSSGTVTNLTGTASININGTVGATTAAAGKFTTLDASSLITQGTASGQSGNFGIVTGAGGANSGVGVVTGATGTGWLGFNNGNNAGIPGQLTYNHSTNTMNLYSSGPITFQPSGGTASTLSSTGLAVTGTLSATGTSTLAAINASGLVTQGTASGQNGVFGIVTGAGGANSGVVIVSNTTGQGWLGFNNGNNASIPGQVTYNHNTNLMTLYSSGTISTNGIYSNTTANAANMYVDSGGILYRGVSSEQYKTDIEPISQNYSDNVLNLKPIWYRSKTDNSNWSWYGLSAEDVALKDPRLSHWGYPEDCYEIIHNENGEPKKVLKPKSELVPDGVQYERIAVLLLDVVKRLKEDFEQYKAAHP